MGEKDIIASVLRGETERFGIPAERYSAPVYRLCVSLCGNSADAEDAVQETFFDAFRYLASLADTEKFFPWLCVIALKPFRYLDRFMHCLWDEKWVPGYREERIARDGLTLHFTVEDGGSITVPAGTFENCRKVTFRMDSPADEDEGWYYRDGYRNMDCGTRFFPVLT